MTYPSNKRGGQRHRTFLKHTWTPFYIVSQPSGHVWTGLQSKWLGHTWWRYCVATSASNMWQSHVHVRDLCPPLQFDTSARVFKHKRTLNQRNFVASTLAKQREKKNSRTVLKYRQFLRKFNTGTNGRFITVKTNFFPDLLFIWFLFSCLQKQYWSPSEIHFTTKDLYRRTNPSCR
jgi:hypothetical protein